MDAYVNQHPNCRIVRKPINQSTIAHTGFYQYDIFDDSGIQARRPNGEYAVHPITFPGNSFRVGAMRAQIGGELVRDWDTTDENQWEVKGGFTMTEPKLYSKPKTDQRNKVLYEMNLSRMNAKDRQGATGFERAGFII